MTPEEYRTNALAHLDASSESLYKRLLERSQDSLKLHPSRTIPKHLEIIILPKTDEVFQEDVLAVACKRLVKHYQTLGWQAKIEVDCDPFQLYKTQTHTLYLTFSKSSLVKMWYKLSGTY